MEALILLKLKSESSPIDIMNELIKLDNVQECMFVAGEWPVILRVNVENMEEISSIVINKLSKYNIQDTDTILILEKVSKNGKQ
ncbi:MAG: Lrp/AsnC ligand binding domain-containing protein [Candidatus Parvarchaeota archaeon]|nr:Lrp/AsnC ligand binding domain-containing protein [Candidatus Rehaiarchaeum fermentans]